MLSRYLCPVFPIRMSPSCASPLKQVYCRDILCCKIDHDYSACSRIVSLNRFGTCIAYVRGPYGCLHKTTLSLEILLVKVTDPLVPCESARTPLTTRYSIFDCLMSILSGDCEM